MEHHEMRRHRFPLDDATADRLAAGALDPSDAPPGYAGAARLLADARGGLAASSVDDRLVAEMVRAISPRPRPDRAPAGIAELRSAKVATLAAAVVFSTAGAAAAANGSLPAPAQDAVAEAAERVGFDLPASSDDHPTGLEERPAEQDDQGTGSDEHPADHDNHGAEVSGVAHDTEATGRDKGAVISETARAGHGPAAKGDDGDDATDEDVDTDAIEEAEQHGKPDDPGSQAPVATPNHGAAADDHPTADDNPGSTHRP